MALGDATDLQVEVEDAVAPLLEEVGFQIQVQLLHAPDELHRGVAQGIHLAIQDPRPGELRQNVVLHLAGARNWVEKRIADPLVVQRYQGEQQHVLGEQEVVQTQQNGRLEKLKIRHQRWVAHDATVRWLEPFEDAQLGDGARQMATSGVAGYDDLIGLNT